MLKISDLTPAELGQLDVAILDLSAAAGVGAGLQVLSAPCDSGEDAYTLSGDSFRRLTQAALRVVKFTMTHDEAYACGNPKHDHRAA